MLFFGVGYVCVCVCDVMMCMCVYVCVYACMHAVCQFVLASILHTHFLLHQTQGKNVYSRIYAHKHNNITNTDVQLTELLPSVSSRLVVPVSNEQAALFTCRNKSCTNGPLRWACVLNTRLKKPTYKQREVTALALTSHAQQKGHNVRFMCLLLRPLPHVWRLAFHKLFPFVCWLYTIVSKIKEKKVKLTESVLTHDLTDHKKHWLALTFSCHTLVNHSFFF